MFNLTYKVVDVMKKTKDTVTSQLTTEEKKSLVLCIRSTGATHIAISVPMDSNSQFTAVGTTPSPRTIEAETQDWCDVIHSAGLKVLHRGTFSGHENIWSFPYDKTRAAGTASSAASDGETTWCGRFYRYITTNVGASHIESGDIFAPCPEGTTHAFDGNFWISSGGSGVQANYVTAYTEFKGIVDAIATAQSKNLLFMAHNNFSEVNSGWIPASFFTNIGTVGADYYGQVQGTTYVRPSDYITDWSTVYSAKGNKKIQWGEWGDLPNAIPKNVVTIEDRMWYLINFYKSVRDNLVDTGKMDFFNYWGGWEGQNTSILNKTGSGASSVYSLNARGKILQAFYTYQDGIKRPPVITTGSSYTNYSY